MGFGLIKCAGDKLTLIEMGVLRLPTSEDSYTRLQLIHQKVRELIGRFGPEDFAIDAAMQAGIPVTEYSPKKVKQSITGNGNSEKEQVWKMLQRILQLEQELPAYDASDALAVAVCHYFQYRTEALLAGQGEKTGKTAARKSSGGSWEAFVRQNPGKVKSR
jgi:crossover junction endodeoxyribonuclease RuvC